MATCASTVLPRTDHTRGTAAERVGGLRTDCETSIRRIRRALQSSSEAISPSSIKSSSVVLPSIPFGRQ